MKKIAILLFIMIVIVVSVAIIMIDNNNKQEKVKQENSFFESYKDKQINGTELATIINKAVDSNLKNDVKQDEKKQFINNDSNSINIDVKMVDIDRVYSMESLKNNDINNFVLYYNDITFKCTKIDYHSNTGRIKYMLFEQITY